MNDLFAAVQALGIEYDHHESDLYVPATLTSKAVIEAHGLSYSTFRSNIDGGLWYDVPFAYTPWWNKRSRKA
jgi:hypothetical protein